MTRSFYRGLLWLHPPRFRERYADEMAWIFDETATSREKTFLFFDGFTSLAKQWVVRSGIWKLVLAVLAALIQAHFILHPFD
jgi:hypothetical protein